MLLTITASIIETLDL